MFVFQIKKMNSPSCSFYMPVSNQVGLCHQWQVVIVDWFEGKTGGAKPFRIRLEF
jgi:hypothetical protein